MGGAERIMAWGGLIAVVIAAVGLAVGAGTTAVAVQPDSETIDTGTNTTVEIVLDEATDGVGSIDIELEVTDGAVANVTNASVAGNPSTVQNDIESNSVRLVATGMDTADTGSVTLATITLTGETTGTSALDVTVGAIGDEDGSSYNITQVSDGELTVESGETTPTPTATPTPTSTPTETTPTPTPTPTATETDDDSGGGSSGGGESADIDIVATQLNATTVEVGETVATTVDLENTGGGDGDRYISYRLDGTIIEDEYVYLDSGEETTLNFTTTFDAAGEYDIAVATDTAVGTVTVTEPTDTGTDNGSEGGTDNETETTAIATTTTAPTSTATSTPTLPETPTQTDTDTPTTTDSAGAAPAPPETTSAATSQAQTTTDGTTTFEGGGSLPIGLIIVGVVAVVGGLLLYRL